MSPVTAAARLYLKCLAELSPRDMLLSERIIHGARPPPPCTHPHRPLGSPAGVKTGLAFVPRKPPPHAPPWSRSRPVNAPALQPAGRAGLTAPVIPGGLHGAPARPRLPSTRGGPITLWQIEGEKVETVTDFIFLGSKISADGDCSHEIKRHLLLGRKVMTKA